MARTNLADIIGKHEDEILPEWLRHQRGAITARRDLIRDDELEQQSRSFLSLLRSALQASPDGDLAAPDWAALREDRSQLDGKLKTEQKSTAQSQRKINELEQLAQQHAAALENARKKLEHPDSERERLAAAHQ